MTRTLERAGVTFVCDDPLEVWRANTITEKEPGTIAWIQTFALGDVFYDIGANIGVYTLLAAKQVGPTGHVVACEPHLPNAVALLRNVEASGFTDRVSVVAAAVDEHEGWKTFAYRSSRTGSSGSQIGRPGCEVKRTISVHSLFSEFVPATHIKVDVDGNEPGIVKGMRGALHGTRSVQIETEPQHRPWLYQFFKDEGFQVEGVHYTSNGQHAIDHGADPATVIANTIFRRKAA